MGDISKAERLARDAGFREGVEAAAKLAETRHREWDRIGSSCLVDDDISACTEIANAIRALSPTPQADPVRDGE